MSWRIAADAREIFVELVASSENEAYFVRTLNRRDQLLAGLTEAITLLPAEIKDSIKTGATPLWVSSDLERVALREHWGSDCALITTEGFENLLEIGTQQRKNLFGLYPERESPFISKDFSFGIAERTLKDGTIEVVVDTAEIDKILGKLELSQVKNVAVSLLNSRKNPKNEKEVEKYLKDRGYTVFCSYLENGNELLRTRRVSTRAFMASTTLDFSEKIRALGFKQEGTFLGTVRPKFKNQVPQGALELEMLEDRIVLKNENMTRELEMSPLCIVEMDEGGLIHIGPASVSSEPGPVCMGKGLQLTILDLIVLKTKLTSDVPRLKLDGTKIQRALGPLAQNLRIDSETCAEKCIQLFIEALALEIEKIIPTPPPFLIAGGWLSSSLALSLARRLGVKKFFLPPHFDWLSSQLLLESTINENAKIKKMGVLKTEFMGSLPEGEIYDL